MKIDDGAQVYKGVTDTAVAMAFMEGTGIRSLIDEMPFRGRLVQNARHRHGREGAGRCDIQVLWKDGPYLIDAMFELCLADKVSSGSVKPSSLSDTSSARYLDVIFGTDTEQLLGIAPRFSANATGRIPIYCRWMRRTTHSTAWGRKTVAQSPPPAETPRPTATTPVRKNIRAVTNGNGPLRTAKPFKGDTSDMRMNDDIIGFLADKADPERTAISADCKLAN